MNTLKVLRDQPKSDNKCQNLLKLPNSSSLISGLPCSAILSSQTVESLSLRVPALAADRSAVVNERLMQLARPKELGAPSSSDFTPSEIIKKGVKMLPISSPNVVGSALNMATALKPTVSVTKPPRFAHQGALKRKAEELIGSDSARSLRKVRASGTLSETAELLQSVESRKAFNASADKYAGLSGTALCFVMNPKTGNMVHVRALLDSGANLTMINRSTAQSIGLTGNQIQLSVDVAGGGTLSKRETEVTFQLVRKDKTAMTRPMVGITTECVGNPFSPILFNPKKYDYLRDLVLADKFPSPQERPFQLLISEPYFSLLMRDEQKVPPDNSLPYAKLTELGWVLRGAVGIVRQIPIASAFGALAREHESFDLETMYKSLGFDFGKFWSGENVGISPKESMISELTALEIQAEEFQKQTAKYDPVLKQWSVRLPWINDDLESHRITDNTSRAIAMWHKVLRSVKPEDMPLVEEAYEELLAKNFSEVVPSDEIFPDHPTYVMTSRPVFRKDKTTSKCRIVINASLPDQKDQNRSLNKLLMPGPNKLPQIMELVLKTTIKKHLVLVDIKKMFLAIRLELTSDKDMLRYVWAPPGSDRPVLLRYRVLAFGVVSSPFQAISCLHETARKKQRKYPAAAEIILRMTYMDDIAITADTVAEATGLLNDVLEILEYGGFYGHKISASEPKIVEGLEAGRLDPSRIVSVLGLKLNHDTCEFMFDLDDKFEKFDANAERITRTDVVSLASQVFDTQGFVSPYIMQYKKLLPMLWHNKTTWTENLITKTEIDENGQEVPDKVAAEAVERFKEWIQDIPRLKELKFPRYINGKLDFVAIFGDASKTGTGVCAYAVTTDQAGNLRSQLVFSKSSLMPKNLREKAKAVDALTIARAELIAMVSCVTMSHYLQKAFEPSLTSDKVHIFTDSLLNLQRIQRGKGKCKPWEERRVCKVLDEKGESTVNFCPGVMNPSDLPSRGCTMDELIERLDFWTHGPDFLIKPRSEWPKQPSPVEKSLDETKDSVPESGEEVELYFTQLKAIQHETEVNKVMAVQETAHSDEIGLERLLNDCSSLQKIRWVISRIKRLAQKAKGIKANKPALTKEEVEFVDTLLVRFAQEKHLAKEIEALKHKQKVPKGSVLKDLPVFYDEEDRVIRLQSRLHTSASLSFDFSNPIIMPKSIVAEKFALEVHQRRYHCSQKATFNILRQKFWYCGGFRYVKDLIRRLCKTPRCRYIKYCSPKMSPLPDIRIDNPEPWRNVGIDYAGPLSCQHECTEEGLSHDKKGTCRHTRRYKVWLAIFTCLHTRAIYVEVVPSCNTADFLIAFRRFIGRNGRPLVMFSDQAKHFKSADKQLRQLLTTGMDPIYNDNFGGSCPIEWKFSTETAPWANGCTERLVGIFKKQMKVLLQKHTLTLKQLEVMVIELTSSVNDRPLGVTEEGVEDTQITPNLLQFGRVLNPLRTPSSTSMSNMPCSDMWIQRKRILAQFWAKWQADYLSTLSIDKKWLDGDQTVILPGDVVILKPETLEKGQWRLARITDVHKNLDGVVTTASVRLPSGTVFTRTLRQIALLESSSTGTREEAVKEESTAPSTSRNGGVWHGGKLDGSQPLDGVGDDPRFLPPPCTVTGEQSASCEYPGEAAAAAANPEPLVQDEPLVPGIPDAPEGSSRSRRPRRHTGYYRKLHNGDL